MNRCFTRGAPRALVLGALIGAIGCSIAACSIGPETEVEANLKSAMVNLGEVPPELSVAEALAQANCLRERGWEVPVDLRVPEATGLSNLAGIANVFRDPDQASRIGYMSSIKQDEVPTFLDSYIDTLSGPEAERLNLDNFGADNAVVSVTLPSGSTISSSQTGCIAEARTAVYGSVEDFLQYVSFRNEIAGQVRINENTPEVQSLVSDYRDCMIEGGFDIRDFGEVREIAIARFGESRPVGSLPSPEEASMARIDATCQQRAGLIDQLNELFFAGAAEWIVENENWILVVLEVRETGLKNAKKILEGAGSQN